MQSFPDPGRSASRTRSWLALTFVSTSSVNSWHVGHLSQMFFREAAMPRTSSAKFIWKDKGFPIPSKSQPSIPTRVARDYIYIYIYGYWTFPTHHQSNIIFSPKPHNSMGVMCIRSFARLGAAPIPAGPPRVFCPRSAPLAEKAPHRTGWPGVAWSHPRPRI